MSGQLRDEKHVTQVWTFTVYKKEGILGLKILEKKITSIS